MTEQEQPSRPDREFSAERQRHLEEFGRAFGEEVEIQAKIVAMDGEMLVLDPMAMGLGERCFEELDRDEQREMKRVIFLRLGLDAKNLKPHFHQTYETEPLEGGTSGEQVHVFASPKPELEGVGLHIIHYPDGEVRWAMGPVDSRLE